MTANLFWLPMSRDGKLPMDPWVVYRAKAALIEIAQKGCTRLVNPTTCRQPNGYPRGEWCDSCVAADGLGLAVDWFAIKP